jgi:hypothetical protein
LEGEAIRSNRRQPGMLAANQSRIPHDNKTELACDRCQPMSAGSVQAFRPSGNVSLAVTMESATAPLPKGGSSLLITNPTGDLVFVALGQVATANDTPVLPGTRLLLSCPPFVTAIAAITATGSGTIYATRGEGTGI